MLTSAIDALIRDGYEASAARLNNVPIGRSHNLAHLVALVRVGLAKFVELLPAPAPAPCWPTGRLGTLRRASRPAPLAAWLRPQGFIATEQVLDILVPVHAHWVAVGGERF